MNWKETTDKNTMSRKKLTSDKGYIIHCMTELYHTYNGSIPIGDFTSLRNAMKFCELHYNNDAEMHKIPKHSLWK